VLLARSQKEARKRTAKKVAWNADITMGSSENIYLYIVVVGNNHYSKNQATTSRQKQDRRQQIKKE